VSRLVWKTAPLPVKISGTARTFEYLAYGEKSDENSGNAAH
jgi:hypothetical protein